MAFEYSSYQCGKCACEVFYTEGVAGWGVCDTCASGVWFDTAKVKDFQCRRRPGGKQCGGTSLQFRAPHGFVSLSCPRERALLETVAFGVIQFGGGDSVRHGRDRRNWERNVCIHALCAHAHARTIAYAFLRFPCSLFTCMLNCTRVHFHCSSFHSVRARAAFLRLSNFRPRRARARRQAPLRSAGLCASKRE